MNACEPAQLFSGRVLVLAPHMDDEVLACGGLLAGLPQKDQIHLVYATDGTQALVRPSARRRDPSRELEAVRVEESRQAMRALGIAEQNLHFLRLPDGDLKNHARRLAQLVEGQLSAIAPDHILAPFRYDRHPDHLALYQAVISAASPQYLLGKLYEYFVYHRYRLLRGGDIRGYIRPDLLFRVDIERWAAQKRAALRSYISQTTLFYDWQRRPILPAARVEEVCQTPEYFLPYDPDLPGPAVFHKGKNWVRLVHTVEPWLKLRKEQILDFMKLGDKANGS